MKVCHVTIFPAVFIQIFAVRKLCHKKLTSPSSHRQLHYFRGHDKRKQINLKFQ